MPSNIIKNLTREPFGAVNSILVHPAQVFVLFAARVINILQNAKRTKQSILTA
jgi:hypothetical protein